jgi:ribosomal protein S18 acetylase RimI-like enzyme
MSAELITREMSAIEFEKYRDMAIGEYAEDIVKAGRVSGDLAYEQSSREFDTLAPKGGKCTKDNCLYIVEANNKRIGIFWYLTKNIMDEDVAFIADIRVDKTIRNQGYGRKILQIFEAEAKEKGYKYLGLNVFKDNPGAIHLYESEGYYIAYDAGGSLYMKKEI